MRKVDEQDLRNMLAEEVEEMEPRPELWQKIQQRSVAGATKQRSRRLLQGLVVASATLAAAVTLVLWRIPSQPAPPPTPMVASNPSPTVDPPTPGTPSNPVTMTGTVSSASWAGTFLRYGGTTYWQTATAVPPEELGDVVLTTSRFISAETSEVRDGTSNLLPPGTKVRSIKGSDPKQKVAAPVGDQWLIWDVSATPGGGSRP